ncbi:NAD(P)/FAD-dependent oxidoreductase [Candidatus Peregrinibacteria bacterium]|nr:NAD(P)/FAD-dependent oxidoreductase [Candidatus Peregrinibacteria bacterium]
MVKNIVILGAGFAGIRVARELSKKIHDKQYAIVLVDKADIHMYTPDLYEVASSFHKRITKTCLTRLRSTVAIPVRKIIAKRPIVFIHDEVVDIDPKNHQVKLKKEGKINYEILVVALGSVTNYCGIQGMEKNSFSMKNVKDALKINCELDQLVQKHQKEKKKLVITIGGGGACGVETAAELVGSLRKLEKKYNYPREKLIIRLIEGSDVLAGLKEKGTRCIKKRFQNLGMEVFMNTKILKVNKKNIVGTFVKLHCDGKMSHFFEMQNRAGKGVSDNNTSRRFGKTVREKGHFFELPVCSMNYDMLIWTGGVMVNPLIQKIFGEKNLKGAIQTNTFLQSVRFPSVFAAGDNAYVENSFHTGNRLPMLAQIALHEGTAIAKNIIRRIHGKSLLPYMPKEAICLIPIGGKDALFSFKKHVFTGAFFWWLRRLVSLKYYLEILPLKYAFHMWVRGAEIFTEND